MDVDKVWKRVVARTQYEIPRGKLIQILSIGSAPITVEEAVRPALLNYADVSPVERDSP